MSQHDFTIANAAGASVRADIENALQAAGTNSSGASAPATTYAFMFWADTTNDLLKQRNAANTAWISILTLSTGVPVGSGSINNDDWSGTDLSVANGGTGVSTLTDGGVLLGSGAGAVTAMGVLADGAMIVGDGTGDPVAESGATLRTSIGLGALATKANVSQGDLNTASGEVSTTSGTGANLTLPGGSYGLYPRVKESGDGMISRIAGGTGAGEIGASFVTNIYLQIATTGTATAEQTYIQASPPYDMGDGEIPLFVFGLVDNVSSEIIATYVAQEAPWHYNGPTNIAADIYQDGKGFQIVKDIDSATLALRKRADFLTDAQVKVDYFAALRAANTKLVEITQTVKQADMALISHPFTGNDLTGRTVVMLDPMSTVMLDWRDLQGEGELIGDLIRNYAAVGNTQISRVTPDGVMVVDANWK